ncbi:MAG: hypothetical protein H0W18_18620 [Acidobacteria bacterium]|nr:hypothetical protein [Acidobacteriota bacterium]
MVLTFAQIEDLLGFTLPDSARVHQEWWANKDPNDTPGDNAGGYTLAPGYRSRDNPPPPFRSNITRYPFGLSGSRAMCDSDCSSICSA